MFPFEGIGLGGTLFQSASRQLDRPDVQFDSQKTSCWELPKKQQLIAEQLLTRRRPGLVDISQVPLSYKFVPIWQEPGLASAVARYAVSNMILSFLRASPFRL